MSYTRVIPRDLFNEAKLLKCIGRLTLLIHDGMGLSGMTFHHDTSEFEGFEIDQLEWDGSLYVRNIEFEINDRKPLFTSKYNSKANYSLYCVLDDSDYLVFDESGEYTQEFIDLCKEAATA